MKYLPSLKSHSYPKSESFAEILLSSFGAGIIVYLFLIIFQPFGTESFHHPHKYLLLFPYTIIFGAVFFISNLYTSRLNDWNIGSELLKILIILFLGSILAYFYNSLVISRVSLSFENYGYMFLYSLAVGIPISTIYVLSRYIYLKKSHENIARNIAPILNDNTGNSKAEILTILVNNTEIAISTADFLCAQSMENYCTLYYLENDEVKKRLLRISLSNILQQTETDLIKKCHRSYIINLEKVRNIKGNAQGYKLTLPKIDFEVPVSRSFISAIIPLLQELKK
ncbi:LytTR family DNA-binding domain-containing protein [Chryseobacterium tructae]|uniref:LytTR family transcriptional regulator DNA-binding domain-containing protein n=1 Tax=Chryseobacterium tructae TaxID=1037380 RepID=A0ABV7XP90_9FLAO|nr:LytTR family DNA-binding domain-containing protein [Chryseobacterium tructae]MDN3695132.1 LytTR family DNA-binding domain-containing protein [Chryseobacterium tructae]